MALSGNPAAHQHEGHLWSRARQRPGTARLSQTAFFSPQDKRGQLRRDPGKEELDLISPSKASWGRELGPVATREGKLGQALTQRATCSVSTPAQRVMAKARTLGTLPRELGLGLFHSLAEALNLIQRHLLLGWEVSLSLILVMALKKCQGEAGIHCCAVRAAN